MPVVYAYQIQTVYEEFLFERSVKVKITTVSQLNKFFAKDAQFYNERGELISYEEALRILTSGEV